MKKSISYAVTLTLAPRLYKLEGPEQVAYVRSTVCHLLNRKGLKYTLVACYTKSYNAHFHGICHYEGMSLPKDCLKDLYSIFRKEKDIGFSCYKPVTDEPEWKRYCMDQAHNPLIEVVNDDYEWVKPHIDDWCKLE